MLIVQILVVQIITFTALLFILQKIMATSSFRETKRLQALNQQNAQRSKELSQSIEDSKRQHRERMLIAEDEIKRIKANAKEEITKLRESAINEAKQEKNRLINQAISAKEKMREEIEREMKDKTVEFSMKIIEDILSYTNREFVHNGFMNEVIAELDRMDPETLNIKDINDGLEVKVAMKMSGGHKERLSSILNQKMGREVNFAEIIDKSLIAGVIIKFGNLIIDGSLAQKIILSGEKLKKI